MCDIMTYDTKPCDVETEKLIESGSFTSEKYLSQIIKQSRIIVDADIHFCYNSTHVFKTNLTDDDKTEIIKMHRSDIISKLRSKVFNITSDSVQHSKENGTFLILDGPDIFTIYILSM